MAADRMASNAGRIRGSILRDFLRWYRDAKGSKRIAEIIESLEGEDRELFDPTDDSFGLAAREWYPAIVVHQIMDRMTAGMSDDEFEDFAREAALGVSELIQTGVYRTMFRFAFTPDRYATHIQKMWDRLYDSGRVRAEPVTDTEHRILVEDWRSHHPLLCRIQSLSRAENYRLMGCEGIELHRDRCVGEGADSCEVVMRWRRWLPRFWRSTGRRSRG